MNDRNKEVLKSMKQLNRLFPNKVTIQIPQVITIFWLLLLLFQEQVLKAAKMHQDETVLEDWKQKLDRDVQMMKSQSNIATIQSVSPIGPFSVHY